MAEENVMKRIWYRLRYAFWLHRLIQDMPWSAALTYPINEVSDDPREDAETEVYYMAQDYGGAAS
jgi:hypothetical protein